jgi:Terminase large subunit, T4likevirus-type, N-terminal
VTDLDLRCALDPVVFAQEKLHFAPDDSQAEVLRSKERFVALNCARQWGKSTVVAILALWMALYRGRPLIIVIGPSDRQSGELFRKVLDFIAILGPEMPATVELSKSFVTLYTGARIVALPGGESTIRGFSSPSVVIVDEAARVEEQLFVALLPMISSGGGRLILLSTPCGKRGFYYKAWTGKEAWHRIFVPATACPRISAEELEFQRRHMTHAEYRQEFFGEFMAPAGAALDPDVIRDLFTSNVRPMFPDAPEDRSPAISVLDDEVGAMA